MRAGLVLSPTIRIALDDRKVVVRPTIAQSLAMDWSGFGDPEHLLYGPIEHRFDVIVRRELFEIEDEEYDDEDEGDDAWTQLHEALRLPTAPTQWREDRRASSDDEIWLAYLRVGELPVHLVRENGGWAETCDATGDTLRLVAELLEEVEQNKRSLSGALYEGALFWPQVMGVHPRVRGQDVGLQLLTHALWVLNRSVADVAILHAMPIRSHFDRVEPERPPEAVRTLCEHYARIGFRRCYPKATDDTDLHSIMMLLFGERGVRAWLPDGIRL